MEKSYPSTNSLPLAQGPQAPAVGGNAEMIVSKDPLAPVKASIPVCHSAGDSPTIRTAGYRFTSQNPYDRPGDISPNPTTPQQSNPTQVK